MAVLNDATFCNNVNVGSINNQNISFNQSLTNLNSNGDINIWTCSNTNFGSNVITIKSSSCSGSLYPYKPFMGGQGAYWSTPDNGIVYNTRTWGAPQRTFDQVSQNYVYGDWIEIMCPQPIGITSYSFTPSGGGGFVNAPKKWSLMGSYGEDLWAMVDQQINQSWSSETPAAYPTNNTS